MSDSVSVTNGSDGSDDDDDGDDIRKLMQSIDQRAKQKYVPPPKVVVAPQTPKLVASPPSTVTPEDLKRIEDQAKEAKEQWQKTQARNDELEESLRRADEALKGCVSLALEEANKAREELDALKQALVDRRQAEQKEADLRLQGAGKMDAQRKQKILLEAQQMNELLRAQRQRRLEESSSSSVLPKMLRRQAGQSVLDEFYLRIARIVQRIEPWKVAVTSKTVPALLLWPNRGCEVTKELYRLPKAGRAMVVLPAEDETLDIGTLYKGRALVFPSRVAVVDLGEADAEPPKATTFRWIRWLGARLALYAQYEGEDGGREAATKSLQHIVLKGAVTDIEWERETSLSDTRQQSALVSGMVTLQVQRRRRRQTVGVGDDDTMATRWLLSEYFDTNLASMVQQRRLTGEHHQQLLLVLLNFWMANKERGWLWTDWRPEHILLRCMGTVGFELSVYDHDSACRQGSPPTACQDSTPAPERRPNAPPQETSFDAQHTVYGEADCVWSLGVIYAFMLNLSRTALLGWKDFVIVSTWLEGHREALSQNVGLRLMLELQRRKRITLANLKVFLEKEEVFEAQKLWSPLSLKSLEDFCPAPVLRFYNFQSQVRKAALLADVSLRGSMPFGATTYPPTVLDVDERYWFQIKRVGGLLTGFRTTYEVIFVQRQGEHFMVTTGKGTPLSWEAKIVLLLSACSFVSLDSIFTVNGRVEPIVEEVTPGYLSAAIQKTATGVGNLYQWITTPSDDEPVAARAVVAAP